MSFIDEIYTFITYMLRHTCLHTQRHTQSHTLTHVRKQVNLSHILIMCRGDLDRIHTIDKRRASFRLQPGRHKIVKSTMMPAAVFHITSTIPDTSEVNMVGSNDQSNTLRVKNMSII